MFLDPDPKRQKQTMSGFTTLQPAPAAAPLAAKRRPLNERTKSQNNLQTPARTVRLVTPSPSPSIRDDTGNGKENVVFGHQGKVARLRPQFDALKGAGGNKLALSPTTGGYDVSDKPKTTNKKSRDNLLQSITVQPSDSKIGNDDAKWTPLRLVSEAYSQATTLRNNDSELSLDVTQGRRTRVSEGTTLQGTPPPEQQLYQPTEPSLIEEDDSLVKADEPYLQTHELPLEAEPDMDETLLSYDSPAEEEIPPVRATIRAVAPSVASSSPVRILASASGSSHAGLQQDESPLFESGMESSFSSSPARRSSSGASDPRARLNVGRPSAAMGFYASQESLPLSEQSLPPSSSPNFIAFGSPASRHSHSRSQPLNYSASFDSLNSRLERTPSLRPGTARTYNSTFTNSSNDTLPPLQLPRKRLRHMPATLSANVAQDSQASSSKQVSAHPLDVGPYARHQFSGNLSTIASESERGTSQQLSQLSLGSNVYNIDNSSFSHSAIIPNRSRDSIPEESMIPTSSSTPPGTGSDEPGDMTLGIFRETSLIPQPLFRESSPIMRPALAYIRSNSHPLEDTILENDEDVDMLTALQKPTLRQQRSGYSIRQRSNSTPSHHARQNSQISHSDSERWSHGSAIFPTWAKQYYSGNVILLSTKVSMSSMNTTRIMRPNVHSRAGSSWTERSVLSRQNTGMSRADSRLTEMRPATSASSVSGLRVPRYFGRRDRLRHEDIASPIEDVSSLHRSQNSVSSIGQISQVDSLVHGPSPRDSTDAAVPPSIQRRHDSPVDSDYSSRPLPQTYTRQKEWDNFQYPRPMTPGDLNLTVPITRPRLAPTRRQGRPVSTWRPPSFVESLDTLIHSRCNRQILCFVMGFLCPVFWWTGAFLPLPKRPMIAENANAYIEATLMKHEMDAAGSWEDERIYLKGRWWRLLNRIMSVVGLLVISAVVSSDMVLRMLTKSLTWHNRSALPSLQPLHKHLLHDEHFESIHTSDIYRSTYFNHRLHALQAMLPSLCHLLSTSLQYSDVII